MSFDTAQLIRDVTHCRSERFVDLVAVARLKPEKSFRHIDLSGVSFAGQNLTGFDFTGANLVDCDFVGARLEGATFGGALLDAEGEAAVALALELSTPPDSVDDLVPDIYVALVQEAQDFTQAVRTLRMLKNEDHIPSTCFLRVLELSSSDTAALQLVDSWEHYMGFSVSAISDHLCGHIKTSVGAEIAVERIAAWDLHPHELVTCLGSTAAKLAAITKLAEAGLLTEKVVSSVPEFDYSQISFSQALQQFRGLALKGLLKHNLASLIRTASNYSEARLLFDNIRSWNAELSLNDSAFILNSFAGNPHEALDAIRTAPEHIRPALLLRSTRFLDIQEIRHLVEASEVPVDPRALINEINMRSITSVSEIIDLTALAVELNIPATQTYRNTLRKLRPALAGLLDYRSTSPNTEIDWKKFREACETEIERSAVQNLKDALYARNWTLANAELSE